MVTNCAYYENICDVGSISVDFYNLVFMSTTLNDFALTQIILN